MDTARLMSQPPHRRYQSDPPEETIEESRQWWEQYKAKRRRLPKRDRLYPAVAEEREYRRLKEKYGL